MQTITHSIFIPNVTNLARNGIAAIIPDQSGIDIALMIRDDYTTLCVIRDNQYNEGASATNAMDYIAQYIYEKIYMVAEIDINKAIFVEIDSAGSYDYIKLLIDSDNKVSVQFKPIKILNYERNRSAFEILHGEDAICLLEELNISRSNYKI